MLAGLGVWPFTWTCEYREGLSLAVQWNDSDGVLVRECCYRGAERWRGWEFATLCPALPIREAGSQWGFRFSPSPFPSHLLLPPDFGLGDIDNFLPNSASLRYHVSRWGGDWHESEALAEVWLG